MNQKNLIAVIEKQILQIESYLWEREFEIPFRLKRLVGDEWELLSWKESVGRYRLCFTRIASFELSGGVPEVDIALADANDETKLKIGAYLENFMMRYFELESSLRKQTKEIESFSSYLSNLGEKIDQSGQEISRALA